VPTGVAGVIALAASGALSAQASPNLPPLTAAQLLADVQSADVQGLSGTIVGKTSLGLPPIPGASSSTGLLGLLSGSHTARVWYAGEDKQRVALLDTLGETDVFHNGRDLWTYDSAKHEATHTLLPTPNPHHHASPAVPSVSPQQAAEQALKAIDPTTVVSTDSARRVANRSAYELVLAPRDTTSRVASVHIAIDGKTKLPLGVQVFARGSTSPSIDIAYTRINFTTPDASNFTFTPPPGVPVNDGSRTSANGHVPTTPDVTTIGKSWTSVVKVSSPDLLKNTNGAAKSVLDSLPHVSWNGGSGRLFQSTLVTALITDDGRIYAGAVDKTVVVSAAEHDK
jgi:outer membrane lipoprotein-sorting protein